MNGYKIHRVFLLFWFCFAFSLMALPQTMTNVGTEFWIAFQPNFNNNPSQITLFISSEFNTTGLVFSMYPGVNQPFTVTPGVVTTVNLPSGVTLQGGIENKGVRVTSQDPITVYGLNFFGGSTDAYLALPVPSLGTDYRVVAYKTTIHGQGTSRFSIVGTENNTDVTVFNHWTNVTSNITLNMGETYMSDVTAGSYLEDVTGSRIQSNHPVAVFGHNDCEYLPDSVCQACDHMVEQMFPYYAWGRNFGTVALAGRDGSGDLFRVVSADDGTQVSVNGVWQATINRGEYYETILAGNNSFSTSNPVMLAQFAKGAMCTGGVMGDPLMMLIPPLEQFLTHYTIAAITPFLTHWVNVVAPDYAVGTIYQDGVLIPLSAFTPIPTTSFYGAQRQVTLWSHTFSSLHPFGVFVYGWSNANSYGYPGGCSMSPVATIDTVLLTPDTVYAQLNITNVCLTAQVLNTLANPVQGVLVTFHVAGSGPLTGTGYTDAAGQVQYCYTRMGAAPVTDHVIAEVSGHSSDSSVVFWSYEAPCANPTAGGTIGHDQSGCGSYTPVPLVNLTLPSGQTGTLEYKWQLSVTGSGSGFTDIPGSNVASYSPGPVSQTTWFRRVARVDCQTGWPGAAESNVVQAEVIPPLPVSVTINATAAEVCTGTGVTFTAMPVNGGPSPAYQWRVNGVNASNATNASYTYTPSNGDQVTCVLTSGELCTSGNPAVSNAVTMTVNPVLPVSLVITSSMNPACTGVPVAFIATPGNGGTTPVYQWRVNGVNASNATNASYTYVPVNGDQVTCTLTSSLACAVNNPVSSLPIVMIVTASQPAGVTITASANPFCAGDPVTYTALPLNGGAVPLYQWIVNSVMIPGATNATYSYPPAAGDAVRCRMTSVSSCVTGSPATSNTLVMASAPKPSAGFTACNDLVTTVNARPFLLKGGSPPGGIYSGPGVNGATSLFDPAVAGTGAKTIRYTLTNAYSCSDYKTLTITVQPAPAFNCGSLLTDIRDGRQYKTFSLPNSRCWMQENLHYGTGISDLLSQTDNCITETYPHASAQSPVMAYYQWDELMTYGTVPGSQGLCPPGWHVPTSAEWDELLNFTTGAGQAGGPMKDSLLVGGFHSVQWGFQYQNTQWYFTTGITAGSMYWSSTLAGTRAVARGLNLHNPSVSRYDALRSNAFSVRCCRDY